jgi:hypothetical protein
LGGWAEEQGKSLITDKDIYKYVYPRADIWEGELWNLVLKFCKGHLNKVASNAINGFDAWRRMKWYFEPPLAARAQMYLSQFTALQEVASAKAVP